jgi:arylsulfatase A
MDVPAEMNSGGFRNGRYRFVYEKDKSQLYDLLADPLQKIDLSVENGELVNQFTTEYKTWFTSATAGLIYNRPVVVSQLGAVLPAYEATLSSGIKFKEGHGWAHDWIEKWNSTSDSIYWEIECKVPGRYRVELEYLCKKENIGSRVVCSIGSESKEAIIKTAFYPAQIPSPDRVPRKEAYEMGGWKRLDIGIYHLAEGRQRIKLRALKIVNENLAEINLIRLVPAK